MSIYFVHAAYSRHRKCVVIPVYVYTTEVYFDILDLWIERLFVDLPLAM